MEIKMSDIKSAIASAITDGVTSKKVSFVSEKESKKIERSKAQKSKLKDKDVKHGQLEIYGSIGANKIRFDEIKGRKKAQIKENVFEWNNRDLAIHVSTYYPKVHGKFFDGKLVGLTTYMPRIKQAVHDLTGFADSIIMKDYIEYYIKNWIEYYEKREYGIISPLKFDNVIKDFLDNYDYNSSVNKYLAAHKARCLSDDGVIKLTDMKVFYSKGLDELVRNFGFVAAVNYLVIIEKEDKINVVKAVARAVLAIYNDNGKDIVTSKVNDFNNYPNWFKVKSFARFIAAVESRTGEELKVEINFSDETKWSKDK